MGNLQNFCRNKMFATKLTCIGILGKFGSCRKSCFFTEVAQFLAFSHFAICNFRITVPRQHFSGSLIGPAVRVIGDATPRCLSLSLLCP